MFSASELRSRHAFIEESLAATHDTLHFPQVQQRLGSHALTLTHMLGETFVPNIRHDQLVVPARYADYGIPVVALKHGEQVRLPAEAVGPLHSQVKAARQYLRVFSPETADATVDTLVGLAGQQSEPLDVALPARALAVVNARIIGGRPQTSIRLLGRPVLQLTYGEVAMTPDIVGHEVEHLVQTLTTRPMVPIADASVEVDIFRRELGAYSVQADIERGRRDAGLSPTSYGTVAIEIDTIRQEHAPVGDPYSPVGATRHAIAKRGWKL